MRKKLMGLCLLGLMVATRATADCPTGLATNTKGWPAGKPVYYDISGLPSAAQTQVKGALDDWATANTTINHSGVTFKAADSTHPAHLVFKAGSPEGGLGTMAPVNNADGTLKRATITIDISNTSIFDPSQRGYDTVFRKIARHEIGHTMGLKDQPDDSTKPCGGQRAGQSVMNHACGVNDQWENLPSGITYCDNQAVNKNPTYGAGTEPKSTIQGIAVANRGIWGSRTHQPAEA